MGRESNTRLISSSAVWMLFLPPYRETKRCWRGKRKALFFVCVCVPKVRLWCIRCERPLFEKVCFYTPLLNWYATSNGATQESQTLFAVFCAFRVRFFFFAFFAWESSRLPCCTWSSTFFSPFSLLLLSFLCFCFFFFNVLTSRRSPSDLPHFWFDATKNLVVGLLIAS